MSVQLYAAGHIGIISIYGLYVVLICSTSSSMKQTIHVLRPQPCLRPSLAFVPSPGFFTVLVLPQLSGPPVALYAQSRRTRVGSDVSHRTQHIRYGTLIWHGAPRRGPTNALRAIAVSRKIRFAKISRIQSGSSLWHALRGRGILRGWGISHLYATSSPGDACVCRRLQPIWAHLRG